MLDKELVKPEFVKRTVDVGDDAHIVPAKKETWHVHIRDDVGIVPYGFAKNQIVLLNKQIQFCLVKELSAEEEYKRLFGGFGFVKKHPYGTAPGANRFLRGEDFPRKCLDFSRKLWHTEKRKKERSPDRKIQRYKPKGTCRK